MCFAGTCSVDEPSTDAPAGDLPSVGFAMSSMIVDETTGVANVRIVLSKPSPVDVAVNASVVSGGSAMRGEDFTAIDGALSIPAGMTETAFQIAIVDDGAAEPTEDILLALDSPTNATLGAATFQLEISATTLPRVSFATATSAANESASTQIAVTLDAPSSGLVNVDYALSGSATSADYGLTSGTITFAPNQTTRMLALAEVSDALDEDDETVTLTLSNATNATLGGIVSSTHTIVDDDLAPSVEFSLASSSINEAMIDVPIAMHLSAPSGKLVTVPFTTAGSADSADYTVASTTVMFDPGVVDRSILVHVLATPQSEPTETATFTIGTPTNASTGSIATHTLTITEGAASACYGAGAFQVCLAAPPAGAVALPPMIDTDTSGMCLGAQPTNWTANQPAACFIVGGTITGSSTVVTGSRPLVLVADSSIQINGTLDAASHRGGTTGPGASSAMCGAFPTTPQDGNGGGGGAGGTFMSIGGKGGNGNGAVMVQGGTAAPVNATPARLRGGCDGQLGGKGNGNPAGTEGKGGGAIYLVAGTSISVSGTINASGAGAVEGQFYSGGSGGGSGGMIVLYAPAITNTGKIFANGGGGGAGGDGDELGGNGADPAMPGTVAAGGLGGGGTGGNGFAGATAATQGANDTTGEGGGGGGGGGGYIRSNVTLSGMVSAGSIDHP